MGELLVLLVCWKSGPYCVPDQQGDIIPTRRVNLTTIAVFLFTRRFWRYAILRIKPTAYGITFSALRDGDCVIGLCCAQSSGFVFAFT